jgi:hypothetical protein
MLLLTFRQAEKGADDQLEDELDKAFMDAGYPKEAAVFGRIDLVRKCCCYCFNPRPASFALMCRFDAMELNAGIQVLA